MFECDRVSLDCFGKLQSIHIYIFFFFYKVNWDCFQDLSFLNIFYRSTDTVGLNKAIAFALEVETSDKPSGECYKAILPCEPST